MTTLAAVALALLTAATTVAAVAQPSWVYAYNPGISAGFTTIVATSALFAAVMVVLRVERTRASNDLALAVAVGLVSLTSFFLATLALVGVTPSTTFAWVPVPARLVGSALLLLGGQPTASTLRRLPGRLSLVLLLVLSVSVLGGGGAIVGKLLPAGVPYWLHGLTVTFYLMGALSLLRRAQLVGDSTLYWLAACAIGLAASRLLFALLPPPNEGYVVPGDLVRLATAVALLMAVRAELIARAQRLVESGIDEERLRLAREIHDGMAQELAFIVSQSRRLIGRQPDRTTLELLADAGQAALADTRRTIYNLKRPRTKALSAMIAESTLQVTDRAGLALDLVVDGEIPIDNEVEHAILRITGEAVANATKHGQASTISINISCQDERVIVRIADDGRGFDPEEQGRRHGFGLTSMVQRVESLGGRLRLESKPGHGTMIEVAI